MAGGRKEDSLGIPAGEVLLLHHSQGLETVKVLTTCTVLLGVRDAQVVLAVPLQASSSSSPRFFLDHFKPWAMEKKAHSGFVQHSHLSRLPVGCEGTCSPSDLGTSWDSGKELEAQQVV